MQSDPESPKNKLKKIQKQLSRLADQSDVNFVFYYSVEGENKINFHAPHKNDLGDQIEKLTILYNKVIYEESVEREINDNCLLLVECLDDKYRNKQDSQIIKGKVYGVVGIHKIKGQTLYVLIDIKNRLILSSSKEFNGYNAKKFLVVDYYKKLQLN